MIYVDEEFDICTLDIENDSSLRENIFVSVKKPLGKKSIVIGNIYKPPKDNYNIENIRTFTAEFERVPYKLNGNNSEVLITGDYNINLLDIETRQAFGDVFDCMLSNSYSPKITLPTRLSNNTCTLIDNIYHRLSPLFVNAEAGIIYTKISDHLPYFLSIRLNETEDRQEGKKYIKNAHILKRQWAASSMKWYRKKFMRQWIIIHMLIRMKILTNYQIR